MFNKCLIIGIIVAVGVLAMGTVSQADVVLNIYYDDDITGGVLPLYLQKLERSMGCYTMVSVLDHTGTYGIVEGYCSQRYGNVTIRISRGKANDVLYAIKGQIPPLRSGGQYDCVPYYNQRLMSSSVEAPNTLTCERIDISISAVDGLTFGQTSHGHLHGHRGPPGFDGFTVDHIDTQGLILYDPIVVPLGFFKNTEALPILDNITQTMAGVIFGAPLGTMWSDFDNHGGKLPEKYVTACFRHAGAGTHASLEAAVMSRVNGYPVNTEEVAQAAYFNDSSSDMMRCVSENGGQSIADFGAIGYAHASDCGFSGVCQPLGAVTINGQTFTNYGATLIKYNGELPTKMNLANCKYSFYSRLRLFVGYGYFGSYSRYTQLQKEWIENLGSLLSNPANMVSTFDPWCNTSVEMRCTKGNDFSPVLPGSSWAQ